MSQPEYPALPRLPGRVGMPLRGAGAVHRLDKLASQPQIPTCACAPACSETNI